MLKDSNSKAAKMSIVCIWLNRSCLWRLWKSYVMFWENQSRNI